MTPEHLKFIIQEGESQSVEFKSSFNIELIETLVAFANTGGGKVFLGVKNNGQVVGVSLKNETLQNWINEVKTKTTPGLIPDIEIVDYEDKKIVIFNIQEYPVKPVATRGKYYKRIANSNHLLSVSEVVNLHLQSFNTSWDYHINDHFKIEDLSLEKVQRSIDIINQTGTRVFDDPLTFLIKNDLIRDEKITNAAYLLFTNRDTIITTIELGRFQTETIIKDTARTKSDILNQVDQVIDFVKKHINKEIIITGQPQNIQKWQYPLEAIREIVINMIIHRDYRSSSDSIIKIFNDRIEFYNPGRLPDSITIEDLFTNNYKSTPRNKQIADFCKSIGLIEKYGSGIRRIIDYFVQEKLPIPEFRNISEGFMVTVFTTNKTWNVTENVTGNVTENVTENRLARIINIIQKDNKITTEKIAEKLSLTKRTILRDIEKLKKANRIQYIGSAKGGYWQIIQQ